MSSRYCHSYSEIYNYDIFVIEFKLFTLAIDKKQVSLVAVVVWLSGQD